MKSLQGGLLLFVLLAATASTISLPTPLPPAEVNNCPPPNETPGCYCYPSMNTLICEDPIQEFQLSKPYTLKSMVIRNTHDLPAIKDTFVKNNHLTVETLTVSQDASSATSLSIQNLESLFGLSTRTIKIKSSGTTIPLDITDLGSMEYVTLTGLTFQSLDFSLFTDNPNLKHLVMRKIDTLEEPEDPNLLLFNSSITTLDISEVDALTGSVLFEPAACDDEKRINIFIRQNEHVKSFIFKKLFPNDTTEAAKCHYHIDLSGNEDMNPDLLTSQAKDLMAAPKDNLYLVLRNINAGANDDKPLLCNCEVKQAALAHPGYFHGIYCKPDGDGKKADLLDHLKDASFFKGPCDLQK